MALSTSLSAGRSVFFFFFYCSGDHRDLHSFPTRRSSDLTADAVACFALGQDVLPVDTNVSRVRERTGETRSEEHTSELQSLRHLVCRLLLEKKKTSTSCRRSWKPLASRPPLWSKTSLRRR